jgi:glycyl-tRNA synthetase beta subunit
MTNEEFFDIGRVAYITGNVQEALAAKQALETVVENANSLQQLKAEIADFVNAVQQNGDDKNLRHNVDNFVGRVRQLSAI